MAKALSALAFAAALLVLMQFAGAQSLQVPYCPLFASALPQPTVSIGYSSSSTLPPGTYYLEYTTGGTSSSTGTSAQSVVVVTPPTQQAEQSFNAVLTVNASVLSGPTNFYIGNTPETLYLYGSNAVGNSITMTSLPTSGTTIPERDATSCIIGSIPIAMMGILLSLLLISVSYMLGEIFQVSGFKGWYRGEMWEVTKSILLIISIFAVLLLMSSIAYSLTGASASPQSQFLGSAGSASTQTSSNLGGLYASVLGYINSELSSADLAYGYMFGLSEGVGMLKSYTYSVWVPFIPIPFVGAFQSGVNVSIFTSSYIESNHANPNASFIKDVLLIIVIPVMVLFQVLSNMFVELALLGLTLFIPFGVVLRAVPFLRGIGGTMLAIGISISLIFPAVMVGLNMPLTSYLSTSAPSQPFPSGCYGSGSGIIGSLAGIVLCTPLLDTSLLVEQNILTEPGVADGFAAGLDTFLNGAPSVYSALNVSSYAVFPMVVQLILLVMDIVITFAIGDAIARMLGGTLKMSLGKFKIA